mgnify:CR=1 FL=1
MKEMTVKEMLLAIIFMLIALTTIVSFIATGYWLWIGLRQALELLKSAGEAGIYFMVLFGFVVADVIMMILLDQFFKMYFKDKGQENL